MMGYQPPPQSKLFYTGINIERRVRRNHPLRKIKEAIDFEFIYKEVKDKYGSKGNVSVPPPVILKLMVLLVFYNVRSERELMETLPERIDWLWFLGYDLDSEIPCHSVLSKARKKWGVEVFKGFFERVVWQCVEAGLVDGSKIFLDSSLIDADASNNSVVDRRSLRRYLNRSYRELEKRLDEEQERTEQRDSYREVNKRYISTTDPDASIVRRGKAKLRYQAHRAVDSAYEVITAAEVTSGEVNEAHRMIPLMERHHGNTGIKAETVVADSKYGTIDNYLACYDRGVKAHIPDLKKKQSGKGSRSGIFPDNEFRYDRETDSYICPGGKRLRGKRLHKGRQSMDYAASRKGCEICKKRPQCTRNKSGRTVKRHIRQDELDYMRAMTETTLSKKDIRMRQHLMERSFARAVRYGFKRARWRRLWRVQIQEYITAAIQNIQVLIKHGKNSLRGAAIAMSQCIAGRNVSLFSNLPARSLSAICHKRKIDARAFRFSNYLYEGI
jgi:transposase